MNKVDNNERLMDATEFYSLGLGDYFPLSSVNGSGTGDMLDEVVKNLPEEPEEVVPEIPRVAIVGRPNVGKSSLVNSACSGKKGIL